jgi:hypothetical protein
LGVPQSRSGDDDDAEAEGPQSKSAALTNDELGDSVLVNEPILRETSRLSLLSLNLQLTMRGGIFLGYHAGPLNQNDSDYCYAGSKLEEDEDCGSRRRRLSQTFLKSVYWIVPLVHTGKVDEHQRASWTHMLERVASFERGELDLGQLVAALRSEYVEADPHDARIRSEFESMWAPIDDENELRTESWAPPEAANNDRLPELLRAFCSWVEQVLASDSTTDHR